ncbi:MAG TPA: esterase [Actinomycetota bacterium]|nr:esterase [Actinomycetota bacterium]
MRTGTGNGPLPGPHLDGDEVLFVVDEDPAWQPRGVWFHLRDFGADPTFHHHDGKWWCRIPRPPVDRMEYLLFGVDSDGHGFMSTDPGNPHTSRGVFGPHSVLEFPGYRPPQWLGHPVAAGASEALQIEDEAAQITIRGDLWAPAGTLTDDLLPLLVVHDGPEYADLADLLHYLSWLWQARPELLCRVLLLQPVDRDRSYSASPGYARCLVERVLPVLVASVRTHPAIVGLGASLGALALTHAALSHPGAFAGLCLQSGSFFVPQYDSHEQGFAYFDRVVRFVAQAGSARRYPAALHVSMTCGSGEENLANNRRFSHILSGLGVPVDWSENRDGHNYVAWRDCLHPGLAGLLGAVWASER